MSSLPLRTWLQIDRAALRHNLAVIGKRIGSGPKIIAAVKANAYGHGMIAVAREALAAGAAVLGVADLDELRALRRAEIAAPVLLFDPALAAELPEIVALDGWVTLSTYEEAARLDRAARKAGRIAEAHFKVDTGMGRVGLTPALAVRELQRILRLTHVRVLAVYSHFASADSDPAFTRRQLAAFRVVRREFPEMPWHFANSPALLRDPAAFRASAYVRAGLALYGIPPRPADRARYRLRPVLAWKARVTLVRPLEKGATVSYGATYRLSRAERLATIAVGYGDGYPRALSNRASVLIGGRRCPIRGRVTMDQIVVDVSRVPRARAGDEVVLLGRQGKEEITADELARHAGTISYEIVTRLAERLPRLYS